MQIIETKKKSKNEEYRACVVPLQADRIEEYD